MFHVIRQLTCDTVPLGSFCYWSYHLGVPVPDRLRPVVLCLLVLRTWSQHFAILRWQRLLCNRKHLPSPTLPLKPTDMFDHR